MSTQQKKKLGRAAAVAGITGLLIFGVFTAFCQPGTRPADSGTLFATPAIAQGKTAPTSRATGPSDEETSSTQVEIFKPDPVGTLAETLRQRQRDLDEREKALKKREDALELIKKETANNLARIEDLYNRLEQKSAQAEQQRQKDLAKWKSIYQSMPPEKAGPIIQGMETGLALELLSQMDPKKAAKILSSIKPDKAVELAKRVGDRKN